MKTNTLDAVRKQFAKKNINVAGETPDFDFSNYVCFGTVILYNHYLFGLMCRSLKEEHDQFEYWVTFNYFGMYVTAVPEQFAETIEKEIKGEDTMKKHYIKFAFPFLKKGTRFDIESESAEELTAARKVLENLESKHPNMEWWKYLKSPRESESIVVFP